MTTDFRIVTREEQAALPRIAPTDLEEAFARVKADPAAADIAEHMDLLREYASKCEHITEFGMRGGASTISMLAAQPLTLISWDINPFSVISQNSMAFLLMANRTEFQPRVGDTLKIAPIEPTDMLFIDTLHTGKQLIAELIRHAWGVKKYLAFHDTWTFGYEDEGGGGVGLRPAIRSFQREYSFPLWCLKEDRKNCNGLVILERAYEWPMGVPKEIRNERGW